MHHLNDTTMENNAQILSILNSIESIKDNINSLNSSVEELHIVHKEYINTHNINEYSDDNKISNIKTDFMNKYDHIESMISNVLDSEQLQKQFDMLKRIEEKKTDHSNNLTDKLREKYGLD